MKIVKHLLKCYFKHIFIILVASKRQTYRFKSSLHVFLFRNRVNRTRPKFVIVRTARFASRILFKLETCRRPSGITISDVRIN